MFEEFAQVWTPVTRSADVKSRPLSVKLAGESVVFFRDRHGKIAALLDRCPHRGVALSLGKVTPDGCLQCSFHGWTFDKDGACVALPLNDVPLDKRDRYRAVALPVREMGGLIWVYTGLEAPDEPEPPVALLEEGWSLWIHEETWDAHWTRAMENMLDTPHVPFVHRRTIGRAMRARMRSDSRIEMSLEPTPTGAFIRAKLDGVSTGAVLEWRKPNGMVLDIPLPGRGWRMHLWCVPVDHGHTRMLLAASRTFLRYNPLGWLSDQLNRVILLEDRAIVASSQPVEVPLPVDEVSVASDAPTLHFRRYYLRELKPKKVEPLRGRGAEGAFVSFS